MSMKEEEGGKKRRVDQSDIPDEFSDFPTYVLTTRGERMRRGGKEREGKEVNPFSIVICIPQEYRAKAICD